MLYLRLRRKKLNEKESEGEEKEAHRKCFSFPFCLLLFSLCLLFPTVDLRSDVERGSEVEKREWDHELELPQGGICWLSFCHWTWTREEEEVVEGEGGGWAEWKQEKRVEGGSEEERWVLEVLGLPNNSVFIYNMKKKTEEKWSDISSVWVSCRRMEEVMEEERKVRRLNV